MPIPDDFIKTGTINPNAPLSHANTGIMLDGDKQEHLVPVVKQPSS